MDVSKQKNMFLLDYVDSYDNWGDFVPVPRQTPMMVTDSLCVD